MAQMLYHFFFPKSKGIMELLYDSLSEQIASEIKEYSPKIKWALEEGKKKAYNSFTKKTGELTEEDIKYGISRVYEMLVDACQDIDEDTKVKIDEAIDKNMEDVNILTSRFDRMEDKIELFKKKCKNMNKIKKKIKYLTLGNTQVGKSAFIKQAFDLSDDVLKLKDGMASDTNSVTEYYAERNGIEITIVDTPGSNDSRGDDMEKRNIEKIEKYIEENKDIDIILWFSKIDNIFDGNERRMISEYSKKFGNKIWKKCIVVLTYANTFSIPFSFTLSVKREIETTEEYELKVWKKFTSQKIRIWKNKFKEYNPNIPVCLVENNPMATKIYDNVRVLKDGTPYLEDFFTKMIDIIKVDKLPIAFMSLVNEMETKEDKSEDELEENESEEDELEEEELEEEELEEDELEEDEIKEPEVEDKIEEPEVEEKIETKTNRTVRKSDDIYGENTRKTAINNAANKTTLWQRISSTCTIV